MPVLANAKYELFAQGIASGKPLQDAYADAGYRRNKSAPYILKKKVEIIERVAALQQERADKTTAKAVSEIQYTRETLLAQLEEARALALEKNQPSAAVSATVGMARILGLIIDRREVGDAGAFDAFTDDELVAAAAKKARELGIAGPRSIEPDGDNPVDDNVEPT